MGFKAARWTLVAACLVGTGCFSTRFEVRDPPSLPGPIPRPPTAPEAREVNATSGGAGTRGEVASAHAPPDLRGQTVAIVLEGDDALRAAARRALPRMLIERRLTRVLYPDVQAVQGTLERGSTGDRTTVNGSLPQLALLQARTPADQLLWVQIDTQGAERVHERRFEIPADQLAAYRQAWGVFHDAIERVRRELRTTVSTYQAEVTEAVGRYQRSGGAFVSVEDQQARDRVQGWQAQEALFEQTLAQRERSAPPPDDLVAAAANQHSEQREGAQRVELRVVLTDLRAGETFWCDSVRAESTTAEGALHDAFAQLLQDLNVTQ